MSLFKKKKNKSLKPHILLFSALVFSIGLFSQNPNLTPLKTVLERIKTTENVSFSYADKTIEDVFINPPKENISLKDIIIYLEKSTDLVFKPLGGENIIAILPSQEQKEIVGLEEVFIKNYITKGINLQKDGAISVKPKSFQILPGLTEPDIFNILQSVPSVVSVEERISNINIRGGTHDQNLILWDGIRVFQSGHFFGLISAFNPHLINNVSLYKNGTRAQYGEGVSGVIDMQSFYNKETKNSYNIGLNAVFADISAKFNLGARTHAELSFRRSFSDIFKSLTYNSYIDYTISNSELNNGSDISDDDRFVFHDTNFRITSKLTKHDVVRFSFLHLYNKLGYNDNFLNENLRSSSLSQESIGGSITYDKTFSNRFKTSIETYLSHYDVSANDDTALLDSNRTSLFLNNRVLDLGLNVNTHLEYSKSLHWHMGYQYRDIGISDLEDVFNPNFKREQKQALQSHAIFSEITHKSKYKLHTRLGFRLNYHPKFQVFIPEPRLSISKKINKNFSLKLLGELKSQVTSQIIDLQNNFFGIEKRRWVLSNNDNTPILKSQQISLGAHYKRQNLLLECDFFIKNVNGITSRSQGFQNQLRFSNIYGSYNTKGVDILVQKKTTHFGFLLNYTLSRNNYRFTLDDRKLIFPSNFDIRHDLSFSKTYISNSWKFGLKLNYRSGRHYSGFNQITPIVNGDINYESPNNLNLGDYYRVDISAVKTFEVKNLRGSVGFSVWNIFNRRNVVNRYYINKNNTIEEVNLHSLGLTPNVFLRARL